MSVVVVVKIICDTCLEAWRCVYQPGEVLDLVDKTLKTAATDGWKLREWTMHKGVLDLRTVCPECAAKEVSQ